MMVVNIWKWFHISNLLLFLLMFFLFFFCSFCMIFFDIHKHETIINDNMVYNDSLQSSSSSSGERECCKVGRNNFSLVFVATVSYGRRGYICHQNERVSEWVSEWVMVTIEFWSYSNFYSTSSVLLILCSGAM